MPQKYCRKSEPPQQGARTLQTDRQTTDGRAIAYSERERSRSLKTTRANFTKFSVHIIPVALWLGPPLTTIRYALPVLWMLQHGCYIMGRIQSLESATQLIIHRDSLGGTAKLRTRGRRQLSPIALFNVCLIAGSQLNRPHRTTTEIQIVSNANKTLHHWQECRLCGNVDV